MLEVKKLRKEFKDVIAVDGISFTVEPGKIFGILGPNGAGKTTTLRMILDIIKPNAGEILFGGESLGSNVHNISGYLPEERGLYQKSKVIDVIAYFAGIKNTPRTEAIKRGEEWLKRLDIANYRDKKIMELSKGNQQKIQFICAVVHDPKLLILDEPFSGFDPINQQVIKDQIQWFVDSGKIIILSTHQMEVAEKLCRSIFLINKGREVISGELSTVKRKFGFQTVKLDFSGDAAFLQQMDEIETLDLYQNHAELRLTQETNPADFIRFVSQKLDVQGFSVLEPTLNTIFLNSIQESNVA
jgi:ABC-2 type transport system ATP-binding protein